MATSKMTHSAELTHAQPLPGGGDLEAVPPDVSPRLEDYTQQPPERLARPVAEVGRPDGEVQRLAAAVMVASLPAQIQRGFRIKMLTILLLQLGLTLGTGLAFRFALPGDGVATVFKPQSVTALSLVLVVMLTLPLLNYVKDYHPWNLICTFLWTLLLGLGLAVCMVPGGVSASTRLLLPAPPAWLEANAP